MVVAVAVAAVAVMAATRVGDEGGYGGSTADPAATEAVYQLHM